MSMKIILAHGVLGFGAIDVFKDRFSYFKGVKSKLEDLGHSVLEPPVGPIAPVPTRADTLARAIEGFTDPEDEACIIAHSMGGLDARFALSQINGIAARVRTLVMIGTPHFGSPIADLLSAAHTVHTLFEIDPKILHELEHTNALHDLTTDAGGSFDTANHDHPGVTYHAIAGVGRNVALPPFLPFHTSLLFSGTFAVMAARGLANDGMVPRDSASRRSTPWDIWETDHADEVGWDLNDPLAGPTAEHLERYVEIVTRVEQERLKSVPGVPPRR